MPVKSRASHKSGLLYTANDWVLAYDNANNPLVISHHIVQTSLRPDIILYSSTTKQSIILELTVPTEENIFQQHADKEHKYAKLLDDIKMSQWTGQVFSVKVGSRGYVAKSLGYALQKLGLEQIAIQKQRKAVSLICLRSSHAIYLSRGNEIWRPWEVQHARPVKTPFSEISTSSNSSENEAFSGFEETQIKKFSKINRKKLLYSSLGTGRFCILLGF